MKAHKVNPDILPDLDCGMYEENTKIITNFIHPPIPQRRFDWEAIREGYDEGDPIGYGETEEEAINDLMENEEIIKNL